MNLKDMCRSPSIPRRLHICMSEIQPGTSLALSSLHCTPTSKHPSPPQLGNPLQATHRNKSPAKTGTKSYTLPDIPIISTHTSMLKITLKGLLPSRIASQFITSILQSTTAPFVLVSVHGIPECTVSAVKKSKLAYRLSVDGDATVTSIAISKDSMAVWRCGSQLDGHE